MSKEKHRPRVRRQVHQEAAQQVQSPWGYQGGHRERGRHPKADPTSQRHHSTQRV